MYTKNLSESLRLRLSETDMQFLRGLSEERGVSVSECIRSLIEEYRRSLDTYKRINEVLGGAVHGDTETNSNNKL